MVLTLKILAIVLLIIGYFTTSYLGLAVVAGCIIGDLIGDRWFAAQ